MTQTARLLPLLGALATLPFVFLGCDEGSPSENTSDSSGGAGGANVDDNGSGGSSNGDGTGGTDAALNPPDCPTPVDLGVRIVGRHDGCNDAGVRQAWSGTGFIARFNGTGLSFTQSGSSVQYTIVVDGDVQADLETQSGEQTYSAVTGLAAGEHIVEVYRRGEASFGITTLLGVTVEGGELLDPPARPERRIEIYGDSITCGYGNEGPDMNCGFSADTENHYLAYGALLARGFDAEVSTVAWSGKGVVINYGGDLSVTLPEMAERAIPSSEASVWDYSLVPAPDVVVVNLGTNDFSTENDPTHEVFLAGYLTLLEGIRARYPAAFILCTIGPLLSGPDLTAARAGIEAAVAELGAEGDSAIAVHTMVTGNPSPGCDWHPSLATHEAMADELTLVIANETGW